MAVSFHLYKKYIGHHAEEEAIALATAVSAQLLGSSSGRDTDLFVDKNERLVAGELTQIRNEREICYIISVLVYARAKEREKMASPASMFEADRKLSELGIILPRERVQVPASPQALRRRVLEFEAWTLNNSD